MLTLNNIKFKLMTFFTQHGQINDVRYENDFDFNAASDLNFPVAQIEYLNVSHSGKKMLYNYNIVIADRLDANVTGHKDEIFSDTLLIIEDFLTWAQYQEGFELQRSGTITPIVNDTGDIIAGHEFRVVLATIRSQNECAIPIRDL